MRVSPTAMSISLPLRITVALKGRITVRRESQRQLMKFSNGTTDIQLLEDCEK